MTILEAAITVLIESDRPLTAREITETALRKKLLAAAGKTPAKSMSAVLYLHSSRAPQPKIVRLADPGPARGSARNGSLAARESKAGIARVSLLIEGGERRC